MQPIALVVCLAFISWLFFQERWQRGRTSAALWPVILWLILMGARAVSEWFASGRVVGGEAEAYDSGSPLDRNAYLVLILWGVVVLWRRGVRLGDVIRQNRWLAVYFSYWLLSVLWADMPFVAFKRWFKNAGNLVMVLVILTEENPVEAAKSVFLRCGFVLIPLSVLFIRYYPELGRAYHVSGEVMFTGVATHKNTLAILVMVCGLFLAWQFAQTAAPRWKERKFGSLIPDVMLLTITAWLLQVSHSSTSMACSVVGLAILFGFRIPYAKARMAHFGTFAVGLGGILYVLNSIFDLRRFVIVDILGRDMTLTTRTEVWPILLSHAANPLIGAGFCSFWSGKRMQALWEQFSIVQAHNGYLQTYLDGGLIGVALLVLLILSVGWQLKNRIVLGDDYEVVRFMFVVIAIIHNFTEASFNQNGLLWFAFLLAITSWPRASVFHLVKEPEPGPGYSVLESRYDGTQSPAQSGF